MNNDTSSEVTLPALGRFKSYRKALSLAAWNNRVSAQGTLRDQLTRAALSVVVNLAEGAALRSRAGQRRHYIIARGSLWEVAAALDLLGCERRLPAEPCGLVRELDSMLGALLAR